MGRKSWNWNPMEWVGALMKDLSISNFYETGKRVGSDVTRRPPTTTKKPKSRQKKRTAPSTTEKTKRRIKKNQKRARDLGNRRVSRGAHGRKLGYTWSSSERSDAEKRRAWAINEVNSYKYDLNRNIQKAIRRGGANATVSKWTVMPLRMRLNIIDTPYSGDTIRALREQKVSLKKYLHTSYCAIHDCSWAGHFTAQNVPSLWNNIAESTKAKWTGAKLSEIPERKLAKKASERDISVIQKDWGYIPSEQRKHIQRGFDWAKVSGKAKKIYMKRVENRIKKRKPPSRSKSVAVRPQKSTYTPPKLHKPPKVTWHPKDTRTPAEISHRIPPSVKKK